jgi:outer membrane lipoprotein LolB
VIRLGARWLLFLIVLLAGCATTPPQPASTAAAQALWQQRETRLQAVDAFELHGRIAGGALSGSGEIDWRQSGDYFSARFSGALGVGALLIEGTPSNLVVHSKEGTIDTADAENVLREKLGLTLPLADLRYWVLGLPAPRDPATVALDEHGRLSTLDQNGWHLEYVEYTGSTSEVELPRKIALLQTGRKLRVVIDRWTGIAGLPATSGS